MILADEPTGNLDPAAADGLMRLLRWIVSRGCAVLMSTHNISNIQQYPSRTLRFNQGRVEEIDMQSILGIFSEKIDEFLRLNCSAPSAETAGPFFPNRRADMQFIAFQPFEELSNHIL